ncbi:MAG: hypothetical protein P4M08_02780 [Oligoflexia bacterium]|nr:hypothetical protein [Oligoflexia bacterium]
MAPEDDFWTRKRKEEEAEERERELEKEREEREGAKRQKLGFFGQPVAEETTGQFDDLLHEATVLIEQLNHLYNQFKTGLLMLPPTEKRSRLNHIMKMLTQAAKPTPATRFKFGSIQASYEAHCARWDKLLQDLESGKIKRTAGPKRGR